MQYSYFVFKMASELRERKPKSDEGSSVDAATEQPRPKATRRDPPPEPLYQQVRFFYQRFASL